MTLTRTLYFLFFLLTCSLTLAEDSCEAEFVSCVQKTGNPAQCRSAFVNCNASNGKEIIKEEVSRGVSNTQLEFSTEIVQMTAKQSGMGNQSAIRLYVKNLSETPIKLGNVAFTVMCADGSSEEAIFAMSGQVIGKKKRRAAGGDQLVCMTAGGPVRVERSAENPADTAGIMSLASTLEYEFPCGNDQFRWITLTYDKDVFRWENSTGFKGILNRDFVNEKAFAELACKPLSLPSPSMLQKAREILTDWMGEPKSENLKISRDAVIGVRG